MKPSFALNITDTTIGLLHRTARGWLQIGETQFDTADLGEALGYLRGSALGLSPGGLTTKLVLPNSQIKYLVLDAPGPSDADRRSQIRAALVGRTPYNVEDLVFDWSGTGANVQVAVLARETLDEAEAFAAEHRFNPVSFVGQPNAGDFKGEPWFGQTKFSATLLEKGEKVDRDSVPVQVTPRDLPKSHPGAAKSAADTATDVPADSDKQPNDGERLTRAQRRAAAAAATAAVSDPSGAVAAAVVADAPALQPEPPAPVMDLPAKLDAFPESALGGLAEPAVVLPVDPPKPAFVQTDLPASGRADPKPQSSVTDTQAFPETIRSGAPLDRATPVLDDIPPAPSAASMAAFASRRGPDMPGPVSGNPAPGNLAPGNSGLGRPLQSAQVTNLAVDKNDQLGKSAPPPLSRPKVGADAALAPDPSRAATTSFAPVGNADPIGVKAATVRPATSPGTAFVTAPNIPGPRKRKPLPQAATTGPGATDPRKSLTKPGGTFASSKERGKPRYLGLILTGLLLLFLGLIAAWSSFFMASNTTSDTGAAVVSTPATTATAEQATADLTVSEPGIDDEMLADSQDPADFAGQTDALPDAATDPAAELAGVAEPAVIPEADALPDTSISAANTPPVSAADPAPVGIATTESPNAAPLNEAQDEIFLAEIDAPPLVLDPLALPLPAASTDSLPLPQLEPPPFGTVYQFDADGRIRPTPEGIITPEGVRLVAGKPSVLPPSRPATAEAAQIPDTDAIAAGITPLIEGVVAAETAALPFPSDPALADARPRARPADLAPVVQPAQADDDASLAAQGATRVSTRRPLPRPTAILAAGEAARQASAAASLTAQAEQAAAIEAAVQVSFQPDANASPMAVAVSRRPAARPKDMSRAVEAAVAAAVRAPEPQTEEAHSEADAEPETASAAPAIPTRASVAKQATYVNAINLSKINLIGVYGSKSRPYALIRQANGRYKKVKVGDSIDGGKVAAILASEVRYQKSGRMISLKMPKT